MFREALDKVLQQFSNKRNQKLEHKLMRLSSLLIVCLTFPTLIMYLWFGYPIAFNLMIGCILVIYGYIYLKTRKLSVSRGIRMLYLVTAIIGCTMFWFPSGGLIGSAPPFLFVIIIMSSYTSGRDLQATIVILCTLLFTGLVATEYFYPEAPFDFQTRLDRKIAIAIGFFMAITISSILVTSFRLNHLRDRKKLLMAQSELISTNQKLDAAKKESDKASRAKSAFLASMSHEIRTPLNSIVGAIDLMKLQKLPKEQETLFGLMEESSEILLQLLTDVLDISKIEADKIQIRKENFITDEFAKNMANFTRANIIKEKKKIEFIYNIENAPSIIASDEVRLTQIVTNLLSNAVKYTDEGEVTLYIGEEFNEDTQKQELFFCVSDTGRGIEPENLEFIKKPFNQVADKSGKNNKGIGVGLGLAIIRSILRMMDGRLVISSEFGVGSKFVAYLPMLPVLDTPDPSQGNTAARIPIENPEKLVVLLTEDDKMNQKIISRMLATLNITCDIANNGIECLEMVQKKDYQLILMDVNMDEMGGIEATEEIMKMGLSPRIIAVTANVLDRDEERCREVGMLGFLPKPITIDSLQSEIQRVLTLN